MNQFDSSAIFMIALKKISNSRSIEASKFFILEIENLLNENNIFWKDLNWVSSQYASFGGTPPNAVHVGHDIDGAGIYVGRAFHEGNCIPAKVILSKNVAYVPHGGAEIAKHEYEVRIWNICF